MNLRVETDIPYGNACDVEVDERGEPPEVAFAADPHGGPECLWFCLRLRRTGPGGGEGRAVKLVLKHAETMLGGSDPGAMRPVVRPAGGDWERLGAGTAEPLADGRRRVGWLIEAPDSFVDVAWCYPYGREEVEALLAETGGALRADAVGVSQGGRAIVRVSNRVGRVGGEDFGLYLVARQHAGETPGSWVLDGFLRQIAALGAEAPLVWAVPLSNVDGVERGDYGKDNFPYDLNRAWGVPPMRHETLVLQRDMQAWKQRCRAVLVLDFHAPGACEADGVYAYLPKREEFGEHHDTGGKWGAAIREALTGEYASGQFGRTASYRSRWETPNLTAYCCGRLGVCGFTIETPYGMCGPTVLTRGAYQEIGARMAAGVVAHLGGF